MIYRNVQLKVAGPMTSVPVSHGNTPLICAYKSDPIFGQLLKPQCTLRRTFAGGGKELIPTVYKLVRIKSLFKMIYDSVDIG